MVTRRVRLGLYVLATVVAAGLVLQAQTGKPEATSLSGKPLYPPNPIPNQAKLEKDLQDAQAAPNQASADAMIWVGRRLGYLWRYQDAIAQFTKGIERYPNDPRFYRHRGHRYITVRQFDKAVADFDKAVADRYEDGAQAFIALEADGIMRAAMLTLGSQFYYGTSNDAKGFPGLLAAYDSTNMVVDAGGTTASTGSSVWGVKWGPKAVQWVYGSEGQLSVSDVSEQRVLDGDSNPYTAYVQELLAYPGLQIGNKFAVGRIKKLTADSGKGLTDGLISR